MMRGHTLDDFRPALRRREVISCSFFHLSPDQLIQLKKDSWRDKDRIDVVAMKEIIERERNAQ